MPLLSALPAAAPALLPDWLNAPTLLEQLGDFALWGALLIVFAECGLLIGFFLPGDSLLFTVGMFITLGIIDQPLWLACLLLTISAFVGNVCGYEIGRRAGPAVFERPNSRIFKREHVEKTSAFFAKHGARAIVLARFVPIVRTFITVTAGAARMPRRTFFVYSGVGAVLWATGVTILGALLGDIAVVREHIEAGLLLIVAVSLLPIVVEVVRSRLRARAAGHDDAPYESVADAVTDVVDDALDEEPEQARRP